MVRPINILKVVDLQLVKGKTTTKRRSYEISSSSNVNNNVNDQFI